VIGFHVGSGSRENRHQALLRMKGPFTGNARNDRRRAGRRAPFPDHLDAVPLPPLNRRKPPQPPHHARKICFSGHSTKTMVGAGGSFPEGLSRNEAAGYSADRGRGNRESWRVEVQDPAPLMMRLWSPFLGSTSARVKEEDEG
jgi:hypothetical protein